MITKVTAVIFAICILMNAIVFAQAEEVMPLANEYFHTASTTLNANKSVSFHCITTSPADQLRVSYCWLQQKVDGKWEFVKHLTPPSEVRSGTSIFSMTVSYASEIGTGTYRVAATYNADGHAIAAYSGEMTF